MLDKKGLLIDMFECVENVKSMKDEVDESFEKFRRRNNSDAKRLFTINCKAKDLKSELKKIEPELIKKYPNLEVSNKNRKVGGF